MVKHTGKVSVLLLVPAAFLVVVGAVAGALKVFLSVVGVIWVLCTLEDLITWAFTYQVFPRDGTRREAEEKKLPPAPPTSKWEEPKEVKRCFTIVDGDGEGE